FAVSAVAEHGGRAVPGVAGAAAVFGTASAAAACALAILHASRTAAAGVTGQESRVAGHESGLPRPTTLRPLRGHPPRPATLLAAAASATGSPLRVRVALVTREVQGEPHGSLAAVLDPAARLLAAAHAGQILCT